ncbi:hypothetical protein SY88_12440 [Clostridiales bacterium PH28_bin88]|nr:hypothetical protein SY88_12440 [Clostridiales bacterium PH28_bin88]
MRNEEFDALVRTRRSIHRWQDREVPDELVEECLELATWAPNGGNKQPWHFIIIKNKKILQEIALAVNRTTKLMMGWPEAADHMEILNKWERNESFFVDAPVAVAVCIGSYKSIPDRILEMRPDDPDSIAMRNSRQKASSRLQTAGAAVATFLLALHQRGLGGCYMTGPIQAKEQIERILQVPEGMDLVALVPLGYPLEVPPVPPRKPLREVISYIG